MSLIVPFWNCSVVYFLAQVAAHVPTRSKLECVNHFIQLPFGDSYCVEPEEPTPPVVGAGGTPTKNAGQVGGSTEEAVLRNHTVANGAVPSVSPTEATPDAGGSEDAGGAQELVSPFTDTSHPLFAQVRMQGVECGARCWSRRGEVGCVIEVTEL